MPTKSRSCKSASNNSPLKGVSPGAAGRLFWRLVLRALWTRRFLAVLKILSIAVGVAVFCSIQIANRNANNAFRSTVQLVTGDADLEVRGRIPEEVYPKIANLSGVAEATPFVEWVGLLPARPGEYLRVLGVDPFSGESIRPFELRSPQGGAPDLESWLRDAGAVAVFPDFAGPVDGTGFLVTTPTGKAELAVRFLLDSGEENGGRDPRFAVMDISWAQILGGEPGVLSAVAVKLEPGVDPDAVRGEIQSLVPGDVTVQTPAGRTRQTEGMMASFQLNLLALSLVSLLVGCYLIYNAVAASVLRRRTEIGILRAIGATPLQVRLLFLLEAFVCGLAGSALGVVLSLPLAGVLSGFVATTISSLYVLVSLQNPVLSPWVILTGLVVGTGASLVAAWMPAAEATRVDPKEVLHPGSLLEKSRVVVWPRFWLGVALLAGAGFSGWFALAFRFGIAGFLSAFLVIAGFSLCIPLVIRLGAHWPMKLCRRGLVPVALGFQNLTRSLFRNSITTAALAAAVAMLVGISVMIHSFRGSVTEWMNRTLVADLFLAPAANEIVGMQNFVPPEVLEFLRESGAVREVATFREVPVELRGERVSLGIFSGSARGELDFLEGNSAERSAMVEEGKKIAISESLASRFNLRAGESLEVPLPNGPRSFEIAGTYRDYTRDSGMVLLSSKSYLAAGGGDPVHSAGVFFHPGADVSLMEEQIRAASPEGIPLAIYWNRNLKERVGEIFDQTFAVTGVLRLIAIVVAVGGVLMGLGILVRERSREISTLRAVGASRAQIFLIVLSEAGAIGLFAGIVGLLSGACLSLVLTFVINKAFFGWTVDLSYPLDFLLWTPVWVVATALLAAIWPAWRAASTSPAEALRYE